MMDHPGIVQVLAVHTASMPLMLALELMPGGDLLGCLRGTSRPKPRVLEAQHHQQQRWRRPRNRKDSGRVSNRVSRGSSTARRSSSSNTDSNAARSSGGNRTSSGDVCSGSSDATANPDNATFEITLVEGLEVLAQIADAVFYLHCLHIVHRDLAARNVLVGETITDVCLADFGLSRRMQGGKDYYKKVSDEKVTKESA